MNLVFEFTDKFDELQDDKVMLRVIEKNPGDDIMIPFYYYDIYEKQSQRQIGKISIRIGRNYHSYYNGNIGYEINEEARGHNYSYYASKLVLAVAAYHNMKDIYITCSKSNAASRNIIERLGADLVEIVDVPHDYFGYKSGMDKQCIFRKVL